MVRGIGGPSFRVRVRLRIRVRVRLRFGLRQNKTKLARASHFLRTKPNVRGGVRGKVWVRAEGWTLATLRRLTFAFRIRNRVSFRIRVWFSFRVRVKGETCVGAAEREGVRREGATPATW